MTERSSPQACDMRFERAKDFPGSVVLFAVIGVGSGILDIGIFWLLVWLVDLPPLGANAVSYSLAAANSFTLNRQITFKREDGQRLLRHQLAAFVTTRALCLAVSTLVLAASLSFARDLVAKMISVAVTFGLAYMLSRYWVFGSRMSAAPASSATVPSP